MLSKSQVQELLLEYDNRIKTSTPIITPSDAIELMFKGIEAEKKVDYDYRDKILTAKRIKALYEDQQIKQLLDMEKYEIEHPTDYSIPNLLDAYLPDRAFIEDEELYKSYCSKRSSSMIYRFSMGQAFSIGNEVIMHYINEYYNIHKKYPNDLMIMQVAMNTYCNLSPEYWARNYMYPIGYSETNDRFGEGGFKVRSMQRVILENNNNYLAVVADRQIGKTFASIGAAIHEFTEHEGRNLFFMADQLGQAQALIKKYLENGAIIHPILSENIKIDHAKWVITYKKPIWTQSNQIEIGFGQEHGESRFVGRTLHHIVADEVALYDYNPFPRLEPVMGSLQPFARMTLTSTIREKVGNPFDIALRRKSFRVIYRNVYSSLATKLITENEFKLRKESTSPVEWMTEFESISPEEITSLLTVSDIENGSHNIDMVMRKYPVFYSKRKLNQDTGEFYNENVSGIVDFRLRDPRITAFNVKEYLLGSDWNQGIKGNIVYIAALIENPHPVERINEPYILVLYDAYQVQGSHMNHNAAVLINCLIDKYKPVGRLGDLGAMDGILTEWKMPSMSKTPDGFVMWDDTKEVEQKDGSIKIGDLVGLDAFSFRKTGEMIQNGSLIKTTMKNCMIGIALQLIKEGILVIPKQELQSSRISSNEDFMNSNIMFLKQPNIRLDETKVTKENYLLYFETKDIEVDTYVDELKNMGFDDKKNAYMPQNKKMRDDHIAAVSSLLYHFIKHYKPNILFEMVNTEPIPVKKKQKGLALFASMVDNDKLSSTNNQDIANLLDLVRRPNVSISKR